MAALTQKQINEETRLTKVIEDAISVAFSRIQSFPFCDIQKNRSDDLENAVLMLKKIVIGNGDVENGLVWKQRQTVSNINALREEMLTKKDLDIRSDPFTGVIKYIVDKILPSLITTVILALVGFWIAVSKNLVLVKGP